MDESKQVIKERYEALPDELKKAVRSSEWGNAVKEIVEKRRLHIDQGAALENETLLVMLGLSHPRDFVTHLATALNVSTKIAEEISDEVNNSIFIKIRSLLEQIYENEEEQEAQNKKTSDEIPEEELTKENILDEIENPTTSQATPAEEIQVSFPTQHTEIVPPEVKTQELEIMPEQGIIERKLAGTFVMPKQEIKISIPTPPVKQKAPIEQKKYAVDPYREPIN